MSHRASGMTRACSPDKSPPAAPFPATGGAGGATGGAGAAIRELFGGAEDFLTRDRRFTQAAGVEDTPRCRVGFPILGRGSAARFRLLHFRRPRGPCPFAKHAGVHGDGTGGGDRCRGGDRSGCAGARGAGGEGATGATRAQHADPRRGWSRATTARSAPSIAWAPGDNSWSRRVMMPASPRRRSSLIGSRFRTPDSQ